MLDELKNLEYHGGKNGLLFFVCDVIGNRHIKVQDAEVLCMHAPGKHLLSVDSLINYCLALGWIQVSDDIISLAPALESDIGDKDIMNSALIVSTVKQLFAEGILDSNMFSYDAVQCCFFFKNELFPLSLSCVRNLLISQGFLIPDRTPQGAHFYISAEYDSLIAEQCRTKRKQLSLDALKRQLENNEIAGEKAELFVLSYEKKRIGQPLCDSIRRISEIDVTAGYDIVSFNSAQSRHPDRFIEVKAISESGFYWSKNEYETAKLRGEFYYLYLVELSKIDESEYAPEIIQNPAMSIMGADGWLVEPQSYYLRRVRQT